MRELAVGASGQSSTRPYPSESPPEFESPLDVCSSEGFLFVTRATARLSGVNR
jgi:hypothetical protein